MRLAQSARPPAFLRLHRILCLIRRGNLGSNKLTPACSRRSPGASAASSRMRLALLAVALGAQRMLRATPLAASFHTSRSDPQRQCDCVLSSARAAPAADVCGIHDARDATLSLSSTSSLLSVLKAPMACLPGGEYSYGNAFPEEGYAEEVLVLERVSLPPFAVDKTEVTNALFSAFVNHTHHVTGALYRCGDDERHSAIDPSSLPSFLLPSSC